MKKIILIAALIFFVLSIQAQKKKRNVKHIIAVEGICNMCKKRIEKACLQTKGVKFANWNIPSHQLTVIIDERKTDIKTIAQNIAEVGHDTKVVKATDEAYSSLHHCCKYRNKEVKGNK